MGMVIGTAAYMAPEQAKGKVVDKRADVWAFGAVLYEMLVGQKPFTGKDVSDTLAAVLRIDADLDALPAETPLRLRQVLKACLQKEPKDRVRDIGDVSLAMDGTFETPAPDAGWSEPSAQLQVWQRPMPVALALLAALAVGGLAVWTLTRLDVIPADLMRFVIAPPENAPLTLLSNYRELAISPDGTQIVWVGGTGGPQLNLRSIDQPLAAPLRGGEGGVDPFVSPDGEWVGFHDNNGTTLQKVSMFGGPPVTLTESSNRIYGASWGADGQIIFGTLFGSGGAGLYRVSAGGGEPETLTTVETEQGETAHMWPFVIPGREAVVFVISTGTALNALTSGQLAVLDLATGDVMRLGLAGVSPHYVSTGHLIYAAADGSVRAVPFDATSLAVTGNPVPLVEGVAVKGSGRANFSISDNGRLVYSLGGGGGGQRSLVWVNRDGGEEPVAADRANYQEFSLSPDGERVAVRITGDDSAVWIYDLIRDITTRLTFESDNPAPGLPTWTPDGTRVAFGAPLAWKRADGTGDVETLSDDAERFPQAFSSDGTTLVTEERAGDRGLGILTLDGDRTSTVLLDDEFNERNASLSPDDRWVAYTSNETGQREVYVRPFPDVATGKWQISTDGGEWPLWNPAGDELFYRGSTGVMAQEFEADPTFTPSALTLLIERDIIGGRNRRMAVSPNGQRFLLLKEEGLATNTEDVIPPQIHVVLNWFEELNRARPRPLAMPLTPGTSLGPYQIDAPLGAGGMGEVYKATDTRLDRTVAIKVLLAHVADDPDLRQRFEREAKTISSLNHPHICTLYDIGQEGDTDFLVMEYLEGETLAERLTKGPLPTADVLRYATEIADALDKAHRQGIVHRDLKPGNIMLTSAGTKLLDFGLAKLKPATEGGAGLTALPTQSAGLTVQGTILGTLQYMAPEQLDGKEADARSDLWAFGAILYEMVTGKKAFEGEGQASLIHAIMGVDPPAMSTIQSLTPPALDHVVTTCLAKKPDDRCQTAGEVGRQLKWITEGGSGPSGAAPVAAAGQQASWRQAVPLAAASAVVAALIAGVAVWSLMRSTPSVPRVERFVIPPPAPVTVRLAGGTRDIAISPDGSTVVYSVGRVPFQLYVRPVDALTATPLLGLNLPSEPFVSPNSAWVGFFDTVDGRLKKVSILGGPPVPICSTGSGRTMGADWAEDDTIIFGTTTLTGLWRVSANGGEPEEVTTPDVEQGQVNHGWPHVLPGGRAVLFTILTGGAIETAQIALLDLDSGEQRVLVSGGSAPRYSPTGHIVYGVSGTLRAVGFDVDRLEVTDPNPVPVLDGVITKNSGAANFDIARDGSLVYVAGTTRGTERTLVWVDRAGREEPLETPMRAYQRPRVSPDGTRVAVDVADSGGADIWLHDLARGTETRFTTDPADDRAPLWTKDGERIVFESDREGQAALFWKQVDTPGDAERLMDGSDGIATIEANAWSADGQTLLFFWAGGADTDVGLLSMEGEGSSELLFGTEFVEAGAAISPDGGWIAYDSNEIGQPEVYVQRFPGLGGKVAVSVDGGRQPLWSPDGRELFLPRAARDDGRARRNGSNVQLRRPRGAVRATVLPRPRAPHLRPRSRWPVPDGQGKRGQ